MSVQNRFDQPVGESLDGWVEPAWPHEQLHGQYVRLTPLTTGHGSELMAAFEPADDSLWTYMSFGPFADTAELSELIEQINSKDDWQTYGVMVDDTAVGFVAFLRIDPGGGTIEIGSVTFSPALQRTTAATDCIFVMIDHAFTVGYRRVEWKCDDLNAPSRRAADRFGFSYEGTFRKATHYKGRSRDTAWYSIIDSEWPVLRERFTAWLSPTNFDETGRQIKPLTE